MLEALGISQKQNKVTDLNNFKKFPQLINSIVLEIGFGISMGKHVSLTLLLHFYHSYFNILGLLIRICFLFKKFSLSKVVIPRCISSVLLSGCVGMDII